MWTHGLGSLSCYQTFPFPDSINPFLPLCSVSHLSTSPSILLHPSHLSHWLMCSRKQQGKQWCRCNRPCHHCLPTVCWVAHCLRVYYDQHWLLYGSQHQHRSVDRGKHRSRSFGINRNLVCEISWDFQMFSKCWRQGYTWQMFEIF